nr:MAG TPA: hypothetical protein [Caudoviricetes sp.]
MLLSLIVLPIRLLKLLPLIHTPLPDIERVT